jgi:hypothetical protein
MANHDGEGKHHDRPKALLTLAFVAGFSDALVVRVVGGMNKSG